jgi:Zn-dependent M16 (insulinase) family peptidase
MELGERYGDFVVDRVVEIGELNCTLRELTHTPSGALVMHIENDDPENLFCLSFQTLPTNSNGVAHILEHTVLCGSKKFPIKDPFFAMSRRSLNTFMNAMTGSDFTCYPAASQVEKDFYNLLDVYIDAVFRPELKELSFLQEGHRLEFEDPADPKSPLVYKGIVFNEMKGSLSSIDSRLWHTMLEVLCPDLPYAHNSGGDPKEIPKLTYEELLLFHKTYYHPSRCLFFFYGNLPLKRHLDTIAQKALAGVKKEVPLPPIPKQERFAAPLTKSIFYPAAEGSDFSDQDIFAFGWLTASISNQEESLALSLLDSILMDTDASPLRRALLESGLCKQADAYMDVEMSEIPYLLVCRGCVAKNQQKIRDVVKTALEKIVREGIPTALIEAALHQLEFSRSEINNDSGPFGLVLFMRSALTRQHGCLPENGLMIHSLFSILLKKTKDPHYLSGLIRKYFLDNPHHVILELRPSSTLVKEEEAEEAKTLKKIASQLSKADEKAILARAEKLHHYQETVEHQSLDCLPKVDLSDVPRHARKLPLKRTPIGSLEVVHHNCFTNRILYADLTFDLHRIDADSLSYVPFLTSILAEVGSGGRNFAENLAYIQAYTGGVGASCALNIQASDSKQLRPSFVIRGKALMRNSEKLLSLFKEMATAPRFDEKERIKELVLKHHSALRNNLTRSAPKYAVQLSLAGLSVPGLISHSWTGLPYFHLIDSLAKEIDTSLPSLMDRLMSLKEQLITLDKSHLVLSCSAEMERDLADHQFYGLTHLPSPSSGAKWGADLTPPTIASHARAIASPVAFTSFAFKTINYLHPYAAALSAACGLMENKVLHPEIREKGGAYGSGVTFNPLGGILYFHSYRDPHIGRTRSTFLSAIDRIAAGKFETRELEEAKLGVIQQLDMPLSPGSRAAHAFAWSREGRTQEMRQQFRDRLLSLTPKDIIHVLESELIPKKEQGIFVCFAGKELLASEGKDLPILPL